MNADMSSRIWFENQIDESVWPDPPDPWSLYSASIRSSRFGKALELQRVKLKMQTDNELAALKSLLEKLKPIVDKINPPEIPPKYRENKPHWQAPSSLSFQFDRRGRKRY